MAMSTAVSMAIHEGLQKLPPSIIVAGIRIELDTMQDHNGRPFPVRPKVLVDIEMTTEGK